MHALHDHDLGLAHDLKALDALASRRRALRWFAGAGSAAMLTGCDSGGGTTTTTGTTGTIVTPTPTPTGSAPTPSPTSTGSCIADPAETGGPYPADGTNVSSGATSNVLASANVVRSDIRSSFVGSSTNVAAGVQLTLTLTLVNVNASCAPLAGYAIYLWHCNATGQYSLYDLPAESYLRGVLVTDANGQATFTTIFPGCYAGRWPHMHFEIFSSLTNATGGRYAILTSQLAMPQAVSSTVYNGSSLYSASVRNLAGVSLSGDNVFGDNSSAQIAQQTPSFTGSVAAGYSASAIIGIAR